MNQHGVFRWNDAHDAAAFLPRLASVLAERGYTVDGLRKAGGLPTVAGVVNRAELLRRFGGDEPLHVCIRLWLGAAKVEKALADRALAPLGTEPLLRLGLLQEQGGLVGSIAALVTMPRGVMLRDFEAAVRDDAMPPDHVLGVGVASTIAANLTVRRPIRRALDIGTGQGYQALLAADHAQHVVATDVTQRSLEFARFNLLAAGVTALPGKAEGARVSLRAGSLFEPVEGEEAGFDLIVSNPPFVMAPTATVALKGGPEGDALVESAVRTAPAYLREGGFCTMLLNWGHAERGGSERRVFSWIENSGCDALLLGFSTDAAKDYAARWRGEIASGLGGKEELPPLEEWLRYYERLGAAYITFGALILRKRAGGNWRRVETAPHEQHKGPAGDQIARIFENQNALSSLGRDLTPLLDVAPRIVEDHELEQHLRAEPGEGWGFLRATLRHTAGLAFPVGIDPLVTRFLFRLDGAVSIRAALAAAAEETGQDPGSVLNAALPMVARMAQLGYITLGAA